MAQIVPVFFNIALDLQRKYHFLVFFSIYRTKIPLFTFSFIMYIHVVIFSTNIDVIRKKASSIYWDMALIAINNIA